MDDWMCQLNLEHRQPQAWTGKLATQVEWGRRLVAHSISINDKDVSWEEMCNISSQFESQITLPVQQTVGCLSDDKTLGHDKPPSILGADGTAPSMGLASSTRI